MFNHERFHHGLSSALLIVSFPLYLLLRYRIVAPFGKHSSDRWRPTVSPQIAWFLFESPNLAWSLYAYWNRDPQVFDESVANQCLFALFVIHYVNRCIVYPLRISPKSQRVNIAVISSAFLFCLVNGFLQVMYYCQYQAYSKSFHLSPAFQIGCGIWFVGFLTNLHADAILLKLRQQPPVNTYKIPQGGLFRYISCANFFGEIVEWLGYATASQSLPAWAFFAWVCANLIPRGYAHHEWYCMKFEDYPRHERWAVIPFVV